MLAALIDLKWLSETHQTYKTNFIAGGNVGPNI